MKSTIFIPKQINVGYQKRGGTYTGKLAYIIYFDEKGKLRKETSWNNWRDNDIENDIFENEPTEGFVLNKKVGDYSGHWGNHRQAYSRVYDPRGFEFEITIENLLFILEHCTSTKGKGLEGEFVYGWDGKELVLLPVDSPDYKEITKYSNILHDNYKLGAKTVQVGATYLTKTNEELTYIGKFDKYNYNWNHDKLLPNGESAHYDYYKEKKQHFFFVGKTSDGSYYLHTHAGSWAKFVACLDENTHVDYAEMYEYMTGRTEFSPVDYESVQYIPYTYEEFEKKCTDLFLDENYVRSRHWSYRDIKFNSDVRGKLAVIKIKDNGEGSEIKPYVVFDYEIEEQYKPWYYSSTIQTRRASYTEKIQFKNLRELFDLYQPKYQVLHLVNGKLHSEDK